MPDAPSPVFIPPSNSPAAPAGVFAPPVRDAEAPGNVFESGGSPNHPSQRFYGPLAGMTADHVINALHDDDAAFRDEFDLARRPVYTINRPIDQIARVPFGAGVLELVRSDGYGSFEISCVKTGPNATLALVETTSGAPDHYAVAWTVRPATNGAGVITSTEQQVANLISNFVGGGYRSVDALLDTNGLGPATEFAVVELGGPTEASEVGQVVVYDDTEGDLQCYLVLYLSPARYQRIGAGGSNQQPDTLEDNVSDSSKGRHRLPLAAARAWPLGRGQYERPPLTIALMGDSLTQGFEFPAIARHLKFQGYKLMANDRAVVVAGSANTTQGGDWWTGQFRAVAQNSIVEWTPRVGRPSGTHANYVGVTYLKGATAAETFAFQYSIDNGGTWVTAATINSSTTANAVEFEQFFISNANAMPTRVRVVTTAGQSAKIIGLGAWFGGTGNWNGAGGYTIVDGYRSGIAPASIASRPPTSISRPFAAMQINIVMGSWQDVVTEWSVGSSIDTIRAIANTGNVADWVMITPSRSGPTVIPGFGVSADVIAGQIRDAMLAWAERTNQNVIDAYPQWRSWQHAVAMGYMATGDEVHPTVKGQENRAALVSNLFGEQLREQRNQMSLGDGFSGEVALYITPYAVILGQAATQSHSGPFIIDLGEGSGLVLRSQTTGNITKGLNWYFSGESGGGGITTEWFANDGSNSNRSIQKLTSAGNINVNMSRTSDWPIVETLKAATTPPTPAAGQITTFARLNGSAKMEYCMVTPSGAVVVMGVQP